MLKLRTGFMQAIEAQQFRLPQPTRSISCFTLGSDPTKSEGEAAKKMTRAI